jgi:hypothetical protein
VQEIEISEDSASVKIRESAGTTSTWLIWSDFQAEYNARQRLVHGHWLSLLRVSLTDGKTVTVVADLFNDASTLITEVRLED